MVLLKHCLCSEKSFTYYLQILLQTTSGLWRYDKLEKLIYDKPENQTFQNKIQNHQYKACLAITGAIQGTSRQKKYNELGLHTLIERR